MPTANRRFQPVALPADRRIRRHRISRALAERFDARLTLVVAGAGHGKSSALAEAVADNELDPVGLDRWLAVTPADANPTHLLAGLCRILDLDPRPDRALAISAIVDRVWALAPDQVALIVDGTDQLTDEAMAVIAELLDALPANGHVVVVGRNQPALPVRRLESLGQVVRIGPDDLLFDDHELAELAAIRGRVTDHPSDLPRLPALADLQLRAGPAAGSEYLWEEVLAAQGADRLDALTRCAVLDDLDDEMVEALTDHRFRAAELVAGLPMVDTARDGRHRLHGMLRQALLDRAPDGVAAEAGRRAAEVELDRQRLSSAARLLATAGDVDRAMEVVRRFAGLPLLRAPLEQTGAMIALVRELEPSGLLAQILEAQYGYGRYAPDQIDRFVELARRARRAGDDELEALAILRSTQGLERWRKRLPPDLTQRLGILASERADARAIDAYVGSMAALWQGDADMAGRLLPHFDGFDPATRPVMVAERLCELGRPEQVNPSAASTSLSLLPPGDDTFVGYAMWLRGEAVPELAQAVVGTMIDRAVRSAPRYGTIATLSVGVHIAVGTGDLETARRWTNQALDLANGPVAPDIAAYARVADATFAWATEDGSPEATAATARAIERLEETAPTVRWPSMARLLALPLLYLHQPEARSDLDRCRLGPALTTALELGRSLVALREGTADDRLTDLPWSQEALLRAHLPPAPLAELAAAAAAAGREEAAQLLDRLPDSRTLLERVVARSPGLPGQVDRADNNDDNTTDNNADTDPSAGRPAGTGRPDGDPVPSAATRGRRWAAERLALLPPPPPPPVEIRTLGRLDLSPADPDGDAHWRRARVRELLAFLIEHRSSTRQEAASALWPDLDERKAAANLRVNLNHLLNALDPNRSDERAGHVESAGNRLTLSDQVTIDTDRFDELMARARTLDQDGDPAAALRCYRGATAMVGGHYLEEFDHPWVLPTRARIQAAVAEAWCRIGELLLARGEPEEAAEWASLAMRESSIDERAGRLLMSCYAAWGARSVAIEVSERLLADLDAAGLGPEPATTRLIERIKRRG